MSMAATNSFGSVPTRTGGSGWGLRIGTGVIALAVALGGYWTITQVASSRPAGYGAQWTSVPGGMLRMDGAELVRPTSDTPRAFKRFRLTVTVAAEGEPLIVDASSFRIDGYHVYMGMEPVKASPAVQKIPTGKRQKVTLTYQVPEDANDFTLIFEGSTSLPIVVNKDLPNR